jgi:hypothetical protein
VRGGGREKEGSATTHNMHMPWGGAGVQSNMSGTGEHFLMVSYGHQKRNVRGAPHSCEVLRAARSFLKEGGKDNVRAPKGVRNAFTSTYHKYSQVAERINTGGVDGPHAKEGEI